MNNTVQRIGPQEGAYVQQIADTLFRGSAGIIMNKPLEELLRVGKSGARAPANRRLALPKSWRHLQCAKGGWH